MIAGIRSAVQLAPSAFLASTAAIHDLVYDILPPHFLSLPVLIVDDSLSVCFMDRGNPPPLLLAACVQKTWDAYIVSPSVDSLLQYVPDDLARARLLAVLANESGEWLNALPISSVCLRLDDNTFRLR